MKTNTQDISDAIKRKDVQNIFGIIRISAKTKIDDWGEFASAFGPTNQDYAEKMLEQIIDGFADGKTKEEVLADLDQWLQMTACRLVGLEEFLKNKNEKLHSEILATQFTISMLAQGVDPTTILTGVHKLLELPSPSITDC